MTDTNTLVERLKAEATDLHKWAHEGNGGEQAYHTACLIDEAIIALSPVLPEDVQEICGHLQDLSQNDQSTPAVAKQMIERLAANAEMWQAASVTALEEARKAGELLKLEKEMKEKHLARIEELERDNELLKSGGVQSIHDEVALRKQIGEQQARIKTLETENECLSASCKGAAARIEELGKETYVKLADEKCRVFLKRAETAEAQIAEYEKALERMAADHDCTHSEFLDGCVKSDFARTELERIRGMK